MLHLISRFRTAADQSEKLEKFINEKETKEQNKKSGWTREQPSLAVKYLQESKFQQMFFLSFSFFFFWVTAGLHDNEWWRTMWRLVAATLNNIVTSHGQLTAWLEASHSFGRLIATRGIHIGTQDERQSQLSKYIQQDNTTFTHTHRERE